jgi:hypothetical protein
MSEPNPDVDDPVLRALANAKPSDDWVHPDEIAMIDAAIARREFVTTEQIMASIEELRRAQEGA